MLGKGARKPQQIESGTVKVRFWAKVRGTAQSFGINTKQTNLRKFETQAFQVLREGTERKCEFMEERRGEREGTMAGGGESEPGKILFMKDETTGSSL